MYTPADANTSPIVAFRHAGLRDRLGRGERQDQRRAGDAVAESPQGSPAAPASSQGRANQERRGQRQGMEGSRRRARVGAAGQCPRQGHGDGDLLGRTAGNRCDFICGGTDWAGAGRDSEAARSAARSPAKGLSEKPRVWHSHSGRRAAAKGLRYGTTCPRQQRGGHATRRAWTAPETEGMTPRRRRHLTRHRRECIILATMRWGCGRRLAGTAAGILIHFSG